MTESIVISIITLIGTMSTAYVSVRKFNDLTDYKIDELRKRVDKHNNIVERMGNTEKALALAIERIRVANHRIDELECNTSLKTRR